jgi:hypothetical protein
MLRSIGDFFYKVKELAVFLLGSNKALIVGTVHYGDHLVGSLVINTESSARPFGFLSRKSEIPEDVIIVELIRIKDS